MVPGLQTARGRESQGSHHDGLFGFSSASTADQPMAETFFAARQRPNSSSRLSSVGRAAWGGPYIADKGFEGAENHARWLERYGARVIHPPKRNSRRKRSSWPKRLRQWVAGIRQIVESVYDKRDERGAGSSGGEGCAA